MSMGIDLAVQQVYQLLQKEFPVSNNNHLQSLAERIVKMLLLREA